MNILRILSYISATFWLLPPLKQFRGKFFYYFLLQALSDPITMGLMAFKFHSLPFYLVKGILLILSLRRPANFKKWIPYLAISMSLLFYASDKFHYTVLCFLLALVHAVIIYFIFKMAGSDIMEFKALKVFYILIILYELTVILKYIFVLYSIKTGNGYFFLTTAFEIVLAVLFVFIGEDDTRLAFQLSEKP